VGAADERAMRAAEFRLLGDIVVEPTGRPPAAIMRAFVDRSGTTCAEIGVSLSARSSAHFGLSSFAADAMFTTRRGRQPSLAEPPSVHRKELAAGTELDEILAAHRAATGSAALARITSLDELVAELANHHARVASWRAAQPPDILADADLRSVLGEHYATYGKAWARLLRGKLPEARIASR
jgi:hypothetical protein